NGAYWSWRSRMGGRGSISKWVSAGAAQADRIHLTAPGYRLSAEALAGDLISEYAKFRRRRDAALSPVNNGSPQPHP
ncbi:MAG: hypothetical protein MUC42_10305, partial [Bryobacter sp.]|nr:hypothetical protein [Bryobacter sp.]